MEVKLSVREKELNYMKGDDVKMKDQMKLTSMRGKESNDMIRQRDMKIEEHFEAVKSLKSENSIIGYTFISWLCFHSINVWKKNT